MRNAPLGGASFSPLILSALVHILPIAAFSFQPSLQFWQVPEKRQDFQFQMIHLESALKQGTVLHKNSPRRSHNSPSTHKVYSENKKHSLPEASVDRYLQGARTKIQTQMAESPFRQRQAGKLLLKLEILPNGQLRNLTVEKSSGQPQLDQWAVSMTKASTPLPFFEDYFTSPPPELTVLLPIQF